MRCPKCSGNNVTVQAITETTTSGKVKGFGCIKAFLGWLFFSLPGILCGLCGMGKSKTRTKTRTRYIHICNNCGYRF